MMPFTLANLENAVVDVNRQAQHLIPTNTANSDVMNPYTYLIDHYVINLPEADRGHFDAVQAYMAKVPSTQLLYGLDIRPIFHAEGNAVDWCLEACSKTQSLGMVGKVPTA